MLHKKMQNTLFEIKSANFAKVRTSSLPRLLGRGKYKSRRGTMDHFSLPGLQRGRRGQFRVPLEISLALQKSSLD
jgi:hypothetical protein